MSRQRAFGFALLISLILIPFAMAHWNLWPSSKRPFKTAGETSSPSTVQSDQQPVASPADKPAKSDAPSDAALQSEIDVSLIDPSGSSVIAGRAKPNTTIAVLADNVELGSIDTDENGEWVFVTEHKFASAEPNIVAKPIKQDQLKIAARTAETDSEKRQETDSVTNKETRDAQRQQKAAQQARSSPAPVPEPERPTSAKAITDRLVQDLEQLVATARSDAEILTAESRNVAMADEDASGDANTLRAQTESSSDDARSAAPPPSKDLRKDNQERNTRVANASRRAAPVSAAPRRGLARKVPVPIGFVYKQATLTEQGRRSLALLAEFLILKKSARTTLTGHADERGSSGDNMELSQRRLDLVAQELKDRGFEGQLTLIAKGESEPYQDVDRDRIPREQLFALDRRVELIEAH